MKSKKNSIDSDTLFNKHNLFITNIKTQLDKLNTRLIELNNILNNSVLISINTNIKNDDLNNIFNKKIDINFNKCLTKTDIEKQIELIKIEIEQINNKKKDYYIKNANIIYEYNNNLLNYKSSNKNIFFNQNIKSKKDCLDEYNKLNNIKSDNSCLENNNIFCNDCKIYKKINEIESKLLCPNCGEVTDISIESDKPSIKDQPLELKQTGYDRTIHFKNWLSKIQGKETCEIHPDIYKMIEQELKLERITDLSNIDEKTIKRYLKKYKHLGYDKYYNHVVYIYMKISNICTINLSYEEEKQYLLLFDLIQEPYFLFKKNGENFGSLSHLITKFAELLGHTHIVSKMKILKEKSKVYKLDQIWKKCCEYNGGAERGWVFIPTY